MKRLILLLCTAGTAFGQSNAGSITGTVFDQQQALLTKVKVTATNLATNVTQTTVSSSAGAYTIPALEPGSYSITAGLSGFQKLIRTPILVETSSSASVDLVMTLGSTNAEITVTEDAPLVQEANSTIQYGVDLKQIDELPVANQSALQIMALLPGVLGDPAPANIAVRPRRTGARALHSSTAIPTVWKSRSPFSISPAPSASTSTGICPWARASHS